MSTKVAKNFVVEIAKEHGAFMESARAAVEHAWRCGLLLIEVKGGLKHGEFVPWLDEHKERLGFERRQAQRYMLVAKRLPKAPSKTHLTEQNIKGLLAPPKRAGEPKAAPPIPAGTFRVIYADPPWSYSNSGFEQSAASQYDTMTTEAISAMKIPAAPDSVLFLWATVPLLPDALAVMAAWGFTYKSGFVWVKNRGPGIGWFLTTKHEHLLIGVRGEVGHPTAKPDSVVQLPATQHSRKPDEFYGLIEGMYGNAQADTHIELFARRKRDGWTSWGNEVKDE